MSVCALTSIPSPSLSNNDDKTEHKNRDTQAKAAPP